MRLHSINNNIEDNPVYIEIVDILYKEPNLTMKEIRERLTKKIEAHILHTRVDHLKYKGWVKDDRETSITWFRKYRLTDYIMEKKYGR